MTKSGGTIPRSKFWGTCPSRPPVIYAHAAHKWLTLTDRMMRDAKGRSSDCNCPALLYV